MDLRMQQSSSASVGNGLGLREDGSAAAILFVRAGDSEALDALNFVFQLHRAPTVDLGHAVPDLDRTAGDCVIRDNGILMTLQAVDPADWNDGHGMLGMNLELTWGETESVWWQTALEDGFVYACLVTEEQYQRAARIEGGVRVVDVAKVSPAPIVKLEALASRVSEVFTDVQHRHR